MAKKFFGTGNETPEELLDMLSSNADKIEQGNYFRKATPEEITRAHQEHTRLSIDINVLEGKKDEFMTEHKAAVKPLIQDKKKQLELLTNKGSIEKGNLYHMIDREAGVVETYNEQAELVNVRMAFPDELGQTNIIGAIRGAQANEQF